MAKRAGVVMTLLWVAVAGLGISVRGSAELEVPLRFVRGGELIRVLDRAALSEGCALRRVAVERDPYYEKRKSFLGCPLARVIELGFGTPLEELTEEHFFLRARDGYTKPAPGVRLAEPGAFLAFADLDASGEPTDWEPIGRRQVDPGPFYLVWTGVGQNDIHRYPWPYQLVSIEIAPFESRHPHTVPRTAPLDSPAWAGFEIFQTECVACHAINGEGGTVGPELNVPRSIVEYRPAEQIKAYIRDPQSFRYTTMPSHLHLPPPALDALVAYFGVMQSLKHDPLAKRVAGEDAQ